MLSTAIAPHGSPLDHTLPPANERGTRQQAALRRQHFILPYCRPPKWHAMECLSKGFTLKRVAKRGSAVRLP
jgi:hypothetical protein